MTRILFSLSCLAALGVALTAFVIRWELASPGASLFLTHDAQPDGYQYLAFVQVHRLTCFLAVMLVGTALSSASRDKGALLSALFMWLGLVLSVSLTVLVILLTLPPIGLETAESPGAGVGWILYPPLYTPTSLLLQMFPGLDPFLLGHVGQMIALPANAMLYLGVYAMASTLPKFRFMSVVGLVTVIAALLLTTRSMHMITVPYAWLWIAALVVPFLVCAALSLMAERRPWLIIMTFGVVFITVTPAALAQTTDGLALNGTMAIIAIQYLFPMGLAWFALPALLLFTRDAPLQRWKVWAIPTTIVTSLCIWVIPLFHLGRIGMPAHYVDYPSAFAPLNLEVSIGVAVFAMIYLTVIAALLRRRA
ncbi:hypothetical protein Q4555_12695 [Octadecabacter sp. 1_MG-2023]|uniref:hypothetical protein n=1 Tax=unclassified Octadecabacter TaxID=196158 RepID=UPI001C07FF65|nr:MULTISPECIES: hypothetical protein [unclassified Octadecabacter]MBU2993625.1 hypothetical protein [Octadecabacter sp. B2R22]MDO6735531.1 hypothetical protein [Octadecabacter sp. 1_MG-2023]